MLGGLRPLDCLNNRGAVTLDRPAGSVAPGIIGLSDTRAFLYQSLYNLDIAVTGRYHQRRHSILILGIDLSPDIEQ